MLYRILFENTKCHWNTMTGKKDAKKVAGGATDAAIQQICTKFGKFA